MPPVGFEPAIPASARSKAHALDGAATGIGLKRRRLLIKVPARLVYGEHLTLLNSTGLRRGAN
jgi:hypothetical protein